MDKDMYSLKADWELMLGHELEVIPQPNQRYH